MLMKKRVKTTAFWVGLASAITIMIENFAGIFGVSVRTSKIEEFILSICGVLVVMGYVVKDKTNVNNDSETDAKIDETPAGINLNKIDQMLKDNSDYVDEICNMYDSAVDTDYHKTYKNIVDDIDESKHNVHKNTDNDK